MTVYGWDHLERSLLYHVVGESRPGWHSHDGYRDRLYVLFTSTQEPANRVPCHCVPVVPYKATWTCVRCGGRCSSYARVCRDCYQSESRYGG